MPKQRNPSQNFAIKNEGFYLTGAKKRLSLHEEEQLRIILERRHWRRFGKNIVNALNLMTKPNQR